MSDLASRLAPALADRYRIEGLLGEGGMACVYAAEDLRHRRKVAIKILRPELGAAMGGERFLREIEIAAGLRHPHILPLHDSGEADGLLYYVMPLVEGETLRARIERERQLPIDDALRYAREVADALSYAHARGVVHRDIKPENILIESGHAVVADFGIAKAMSARAKAAALTGTGTSVGTPAYMSPEQATGGGEELDGRSDLYSLGCVLFEMLAGQPPFTAATAEALVRQHVMTPAPPVTQFRPSVPPAVSDALMRALAKSPADRFNPVGQFSAALERGPAGAFTTPAPAPPTARRMRWPLVAAGIAALVVAGAAWAVVGRRGATPAGSPGTPRTIAVLAFENLSGDTSVAPLILGVHAEMVTQLTKLGGLAVASRSSALEYRGSRKTEREIARELGVESLLSGSVQRVGDQVRFSVALTDAPRGRELWGETYDRQYTAAHLFEMQGDIARRVAAALEVELSARQQQQIARAPTSSTEALNLYYRAQAHWHDRQPVSDTVALRQLERAVALDSGFVAAWGLLAQVRSWLVRRGTYPDTLPAFLAARRTRELAPGSLEAATAQGYYRYYVLGDFRGALQELEAADRLLPNSVELLEVMALLQRRLGRWDESIALLERAARIEPRSVSVSMNLGQTFVLMRRRVEAERAIERGLAIAPNQAGPMLGKFELLESIGDTAGMRSVLSTVAPMLDPSVRAAAEGRLAMFARDFPRASREFARRAVDRRSGRLGQRSLTLALAAAAAGDSALVRAHTDTLLRWARPVLAFRRRSGSNDPFGGQAIVEAHMAVAHALRGEREASRRFAESAARYDTARDAVEAVDPLRMVAISYMLTGRRTEAVALLARLLAVPSTLTVAELRLDPTYDGLRGEAAFQRMVADGR